jgi:6-pyruvoyltetrahydropterin/6-carboxytetrahydropterin synthase
MFELMVEDSFNAAHQLKGYEGPCEKLHGHTWKVCVFLSGSSRDSLGMVVDFKIVRKKLRACLDELDHSNLNDLADFSKENPTSENVAKLVFTKLKGSFGKLAEVSKVTVFESPIASATYYE